MVYECQFAVNVKVTLVQVAFSLVLSICIVNDEVFDVVNFSTPFVKPSLLPTVASYILTLILAIVVI